MKKRVLLFLSAVLLFLWPTRVLANSFGIQIDGKFNDWQAQPKTELKVSGDDYNIKQASLLADEDYLYFYLNMAPYTGNGYNTLQTSSYKLTIQNKVIWLDFEVHNLHSLTVGKLTPFKIKAWAEDGSLGSGKILNNAQAMLVRQPVKTGYSDVIEMRIPLRDFNLALSSQATISLSNQNLGEQTLTTTGASSWPFLLVGLALLLSLLGVSRYVARKHA